MSAWDTPAGIAKLAPIADSDALLATWFRIVRQRLAGEPTDRAIDHLARRLAATREPPALAVAVHRLAIDPFDALAVLLAYELDDSFTGPLTVAGVAAARADRSVARALDAIEALAARRLAIRDATDEPARTWAVRADRRWFALAAGRLDVPAPLRLLPAPAAGRLVTIRVDGDVAPEILVREATIHAAAVSLPDARLAPTLTAAGIPVIVGHG